MTERPVALPPVTREQCPMPITPFLNGEPFDPESRRVLRVALEMVCIALRTGDCDEGVQQAIAKNSSRLSKPVNAIPIFCAKKH